MASTFTCNLLISFLIILYQLHFFCCLAESDSPVEIVASNEQDSNEVDENSNEEDIEIESFVYRELGCPIVAERVHFDLEQVNFPNNLIPSFFNPKFYIVPWCLENSIWQYELVN